MNTTSDREITGAALLAGPGTIAEATAGTLLWLDPARVELGPNIRTGISLDPEFLESVKRLGILQPVGVTITPEGAARIRLGASRRQAAQDTGRLLPCFVLCREQDATQEQIDALVQQWAENERRSPLTDADRAKAIQQALDLGLSEPQAAKRLGVTRATVRAASAVAGSETARDAAVNQGLTLDQAAQVAKYDGDPAAVTSLIDASRRGGFAQAAQRLADAAAFTEARGKLITELRGQGLTVPDEHPGHQNWLYLYQTPGGERLDADTHAECPGHAAWVGESDMRGTGIPVPQFYCTDPAGNGHVPHSSTRPDGPMDDKAKADLRRVKAGNAQWRAARTVRREWLTQWLTRRTLPGGELQWATVMILTVGHEAGPLLRYQMERKHKIATSLLGVEWPEDMSWHDPAPLLKLAQDATGKRAEVILYALAVGALESGLTDDTWREQVPATRHESVYLAHLITLGYDASPIEAAVAKGETPDPLAVEAS